MVKLIVVKIKFSACVKPTLGSVLTQELKIRQSNTVIFFYSICPFSYINTCKCQDYIQSFLDKRSRR